MRRIAGIAVLAAVALALLSAAPSGAYVVFEARGFLSPTGGIALGPDGNLWVSETGNGSVVRLKPDGTLIKRYDAVGLSPGAVTVSGGGRIWVAMQGEPKVVWFDATAPDPAAHPLSTMPASNCGVADLAAGNGRLFLTMPGVGCDQLASVNDDVVSNPSFTTVIAGRITTLAFHNGQLFASDPDNGNISHMTPGLDPIGTVTMDVGGPGPLAFDGLDRVWAPDIRGGQLFRFAATQDQAIFDKVPVTGGTLVQPRSIVSGADGRLYVTGGSGGNLVRIDPGSGAFAFYPIGGGGSPFRIVNGPDGDFYMTDSTTPRILRFVNGAPRAFTGAAAAVSENAASASASVDPRGNDTSVVFDYGPTTDYGTTTQTVALPAGAGAVPVTSVITGLAANTTYHVRTRATSGEGQVVGQDVTVTTPKPPSGTPILNARATFTWAFGKRFTVIKKFRITGLKGGETATVRCSTKKRGCPFSKKTFKKLKKGTRKLDKLLRKRHLKVGAKLDVRITKKNSVGSSVKLTVRRDKDPKVSRGCLPPGAKKPKKC